MAGKGDRKGALRIVKEVRTAEDRTEPAVLIASIYAQLGMADEMFEWLDRAVAVKSTPIYIAVIGLEFAPYTSDPRYRKFLESTGLPHPARA